MAAAPPAPSAAPIPLTPGDARLLDAAPVLALLRLHGAADPRAVRRAFVEHLPARVSATLTDGLAGPELQPAPAHVGFAVLDVPAGAVDDRLGPGVPLADLAAVGLGDAPARAPLCSLVHLRAPDGDALALRVSHAVADGIGVVRLLGRIAEDLASLVDGRPASGRLEAPATWRGPDACPSAFVPGAGRRWLSALPLSRGCREEIATVTRAADGASPTVCRMAVVARRLAPLVLPAGAGLRIRIPIDLRHRALGIPADATGNQWLDALAVLPGPHERLPPTAELADAVHRTIRDRVAELSPADVDHRIDQSLRLTRDLAGEPIRRGVDLVHSSLPTPTWRGVRALHVLGSATLGVVDQRGTDRVDVVTPRPWPADVTAL